MKAGWRFGASEWVIFIGAVLFVAVLAISAWWEPDIRWLHFFQSWMYLAAVGLSLRGSRWGLFIGASAAALWAYSNLFVNTFFMSGLHELWSWLDSGTLTRPDQVIAVPAWTSNILILAGCLWAYSQRPDRSRRDLVTFVFTFVLTTDFFAVDIALFQPRYLALFPRMLHPHLP